MKKYILTTIITLLLSSNYSYGYEQVVVKIDDLLCTIEHGEKICTDKNLKPFTGIAFSLGEKGNIKGEYNSKDGKLVN